jgi:hypothetical protein
MKLSFILLALIALTGIAGASTVTLTGTCYSSIVNQTNNYMQFNLTNSGNGTATNFLLEPIITGATTKNASILIPLVAPGATYIEKIYLSNFSLPGSYVERFVAKYSQGSSSFVTIFPCLTNINRTARSLIAITGIERKGNDVRINITNIADYPINGQVSVYAPPAFTVNDSIQNITAKPYAISNFSFDVATPQYTNAEFPVAISVSYINNSVHYATLAVTTITFGGNTSLVNSIVNGNGILFIIGAIIIVIIALIVLSIVIKKKT